jgi:ABC-2 type transport system permease protein
MSTLANRPVVVSRRIDPSAVVALFRMTVAQLVRGRRIVVLALLFSLPVVFALLAQRYSPRYDAEAIEGMLVFLLIPQTLIPLTALVFASGMIRDEIEEQTLTYLLIRPLPREAIYLVKLAATFTVTAVLTTIFTLLTFLVIDWNEPDLWGEVFPWMPLQTSAAMLLALAAYSSIFALLSVFTSRTLVFGVGYIIIFEGLIANVEFIVRKLTIMYQFRVLTIRWLDLKPKDWNIDLTLAPSGLWAALNLAIAAVVCSALGAWFFARREFRLKTPEGA